MPFVLFPEGIRHTLHDVCQEKARVTVRNFHAQELDVVMVLGEVIAIHVFNVGKYKPVILVKES